MLRWLFVALHLLAEATAARRDARIRFLKAQVEILRRKLGGNRVIPSPDDRARLLAIGQELDHKVADVIGIVTPQTYCRWVTELREGKKAKRVGRPKIARNLREIVVRLARENCGWGYRRIVGELRKLRLRLGRSSVRRILKEEGLTPSPTRRGRAEETVWRKFIRLHVNTLVACDFLSKSVITPLGARLAYCAWRSSMSAGGRSFSALRRTARTTSGFSSRVEMSSCGLRSSSLERGSFFTIATASSRRRLESSSGARVLGLYAYPCWHQTRTRFASGGSAP